MQVTGYTIDTWGLLSSAGTSPFPFWDKTR